MFSFQETIYPDDMKAKFILSLKIVAVTASVSLMAWQLMTESRRAADKSYLEGYGSGYGDASKCYQEWLLEVGYAEFDKRTGVWKLADANTIQGDLIEPRRRVAYATIDEQIHSIEDELVLLRKQQALNNKRKTDIKKSAVDFKKL